VPTLNPEVLDDDRNPGPRGERTCGNEIDLSRPENGQVEEEIA
jgi:hypothetical protein